MVSGCWLPKYYGVTAFASYGASRWSIALNNGRATIFFQSSDYQTFTDPRIRQIRQITRIKPSTSPFTDHRSALPPITSPSPITDHQPFHRSPALPSWCASAFTPLSYPDVNGKNQTALPAGSPPALAVGRRIDIHECFDLQSLTFFHIEIRKGHSEAFQQPIDSRSVACTGGWNRDFEPCLESRFNR